MTLPGVDDGNPCGPGRPEQGGQGQHHGLKQTDVVAKGLAESAWQQEVPLHVYDKQSRVPQVQGNRIGTGLDEREVAGGGRRGCLEGEIGHGTLQVVRWADRVATLRRRADVQSRSADR